MGCIKGSEGVEFRTKVCEARRIKLCGKWTIVFSNTHMLQAKMQWFRRESKPKKKKKEQVGGTSSHFYPHLVQMNPVNKSISREEAPYWNGSISSSYTEIR